MEAQAEVLQFRKERTFEETERERVFLQYIGAVSFELRSVMTREHLFEAMISAHMREPFTANIKELVECQKSTFSQESVEIARWRNILEELLQMYNVIEDVDFQQYTRGVIVRSHVTQMNETLTLALQLLDTIDKK